MGRLLTCIDRFPIGHRSSEIWHLDFGEKFAFFTHCFPSVFLQWPSMDFGWFSMFFRGKSSPDIPQSVSRPKIWFLIDLWWFQSDWSTPVGVTDDLSRFSEKRQTSPRAVGYNNLTNHCRSVFKTLVQLKNCSQVTLVILTQWCARIAQESSLDCNTISTFKIPDSGICSIPDSGV